MYRERLLQQLKEIGHIFKDGPGPNFVTPNLSSGVKKAIKREDISI
jgi:hypothetical protein